jgi:predicted  nucleic acid-binding Zn-ribbon protein
MSARYDYVQKMKNRLNEINGEIENLDVKVRRIDDDEKIEHQKNLAEIRDSREQISQDLDRLHMASDEEWESLKAQVERDWETFEHSVNYFRSHFGQQG